MSNKPTTGKIRGAAQAVRSHPVLTVLSLFVVGAGALVVVNKRNSDKFGDIELPQATDVPASTNNGDVLLGEIRDDDKGLKRLADRDGTEGGDDSISREIRP